MSSRRRSKPDDEGVSGPETTAESENLLRPPIGPAGSLTASPAISAMSADSGLSEDEFERAGSRATGRDTGNGVADHDEEDDEANNDVFRGSDAEDGPGSDKEEADRGESPANDEDDSEEHPLTLQEELGGMSIEERQEAINEEHPFGIPIWKPALHVKHRTIDSVAEADILAEPPSDARAVTPLRLHVLNLLWTLTFGWILALLFFLGSFLANFCSVGCLVLEMNARSEDFGSFALLLREMSPYVLSPFGWYLVRIPSASLEPGLEGSSGEPNAATSPTSPLLELPEPSPPPTRSLWGFRIILILSVFPLQLIVATLCWILVAPIPMARFLWHLALELWKDPLRLRVRAPEYHAHDTEGGVNGNTGVDEPRSPLGDTAIFVRGRPGIGVPRASTELGQQPGDEVLVLSIHRSISLRYLKYTVGGINVVIVNSLIIPLLTLLLSVLPLHYSSPITIFILALLSVVPCAYFIGSAVSSITNLTGNLALGAILNATFGSIVEILIYVAMVRQGDKSKLVEGSLIGSFLFGMLCMPGLAMFFGGMAKTSMGFNVRATGVTVTLLIMSVIGVLVPTLFHNTFAPWDLYCRSCTNPNSGRGIPVLATNDDRLRDSPSDTSCEMAGCWMKQTTGSANPLFNSHTKPLMYFCAAILVLTYCVGLVYTLRTHQKHIYKKGAKRSRTAKKGMKSKGDALAGPKIVKVTGMTPKIGWNSPRTPAGERPSTLERRRFPKLGAAQSSPRPGAILPLRPAQLLNLDTAPKPQQPAATATTEGLGVQIPAAQAGAGASSVNEAPISSGTIAPDQMSISSTSSVSSRGESGHGGPAWGTAQSVIVLLLSTILFALVAEVLTDNVDAVLDPGTGDGIKLDQKLLGLTLFAIVPSITEVYNSVSFALVGKMQLSMEIANQYTAQVALLQIPLIVAYSALHDYISNRPPGVDGGFSLVFPRWDAYAILFSVFLISYIYVEGKATYFKGAMLVLAYLVLVVSFGFVPAQFEEQVVALGHGGLGGRGVGV